MATDGRHVGDMIYRDMMNDDDEFGNGTVDDAEYCNHTVEPYDTEFGNGKVDVVKSCSFTGDVEQNGAESGSYPGD
eukprot:2114410-Alexandrium_andersonii.AAC.1